jgi:probable selenium-dependent hydroxylase accessory protein YqeC
MDIQAKATGRANAISRMLGIKNGTRVAVAGCGGKTSLINLIASENLDKKVLISPTTKILPLVSEEIALRVTRHDCLSHVPAAGIQCLGVLDAKGRKLRALPEGDLAAIANGYDLALMEADGSRGLPCKGWTERDPVIPEFTTHTIGVASIKAVGMRADDENVFRLGDFLAMTGLERGEAITARSLALMIASPHGMMRRGRGRQIVIINQAETAEEMSNAELLASLIRQSQGARFNKIIAGSVQQNAWREA